MERHVSDVYQRLARGFLVQLSVRVNLKPCQGLTVKIQRKPEEVKEGTGQYFEWREIQGKHTNRHIGEVSKETPIATVLLHSPNTRVTKIWLKNTISKGANLRRERVNKMLITSRLNPFNFLFCFVVDNERKQETLTTIWTDERHCPSLWQTWEKKGAKTVCSSDSNQESCTKEEIPLC